MNKEDYCPKCDNELTYIPSSLLFGECYYCEYCDTFYRNTLTPVSDQSFSIFSTDRRNELKNLAKVIIAKSKVTKEDLITLGYL